MKRRDKTTTTNEEKNETKHAHTHNLTLKIGLHGIHNFFGAVWLCHCMTIGFACIANHFQSRPCTNTHTHSIALHENGGKNQTIRVRCAHMRTRERDGQRINITARSECACRFCDCETRHKLHSPSLRNLVSSMHAIGATSAALNGKKVEEEEEGKKIKPVVVDLAAIFRVKFILFRFSLTYSLSVSIALIPKWHIMIVVFSFDAAFTILLYEILCWFYWLGWGHVDAVSITSLQFFCRNQTKSAQQIKNIDSDNTHTQTQRQSEIERWRTHASKYSTQTWMKCDFGQQVSLHIHRDSNV